MNLQPRNVKTSMHLPHISPISSKSNVNANDRKVISRATIKKQNTQASIPFQQISHMENCHILSPSYSNRNIIGPLSLRKAPLSPTLKKDNGTIKNNENDNINSTSSINLLSNKINPVNVKPSFNSPNIILKKRVSKAQIQNQNHKIAVKSSLLPKVDRNIISIRFESNWENTSEICLYFISLVDKSNHQIDPFESINKNDENDDSKNIYIASLPEISSLEKLEKLLNSSYLKDENSLFSEHLDDQKFTIFLSVHNSISIGGIRIFNPPTKNQSSVKDVSVYVNAEFCCKGEVPQNFGINLKLNVSSSIPSNQISLEENQLNVSMDDTFIQESDYLIPRVLVHRDKYGLLPTIPVKELKIKIVETYMGNINLEKLKNKSSNSKKSNENYVGINGFDIFDLFGNPIYTCALLNESKSKNKDGNNYYQTFTSDLENGCIKEVNIRGISELINCGMLLKKEKKTNKPEDMLLGEMDGTQYPTFIFKFTKPTCISKIIIWNYNGSGDNLQCGVRKLKMYTDDQLFWYGKIPCCDGNVKDMINYTKSIQMYDPIPDIVQVKL